MKQIYFLFVVLLEMCIRDSAESFEEGDARFLSRWKLRTVNQDTYYQGLAKGYFNGAGLTTWPSNSP